MTTLAARKGATNKTFVFVNMLTLRARLYITRGTSILPDDQCRFDRNVEVHFVALLVNDLHQLLSNLPARLFIREHRQPVVERECFDQWLLEELFSVYQLNLRCACATPH